MFNPMTGQLPNSAGVKRLTIGVTGRDGKRAALEFKAESTAAPLVAVISGIETDGGDASPEPPTRADLAEMSAYFDNAETPLGEIYGGE